MNAEFDFDRLTVRRNTYSDKWDVGDRPEDLIPLWVADMDFEAAPCIVDALRRRVEHGVFGYVRVPERFYEAIIGWFGRRHGWTIEHDWIQYTIGTIPAMSAIIKALTKPGDKVLAITPVYTCFFSSIRNNGCTLVESPLVNDGGTYTLDFDDLRRKTADPGVKMLLLCNPHNPVGRVWTADELRQVAEICAANGVLIVSDEIHCELAFDGHRYVPFGSLSPEIMDNAIVCVSPSKSFNIAGLQIAAIVCNDPERRRLIDRAININEVCEVNLMGVEALIAAYTEGEPWILALCDYVYGNYRLLADTFARHLPQLTVTPLEGTYLAWIDIRPTGMKSDELTRKLYDSTHVMLSSGTLYGAAGEGFARVNLATQRSRLAEGLRRMVDFLR